MSKAGGRAGQQACGEVLVGSCMQGGGVGSARPWHWLPPTSPLCHTVRQPGGEATPVERLTGDAAAAVPVLMCLWCCRCGLSWTRWVRTVRRRRKRRMRTRTASQVGQAATHSHTAGLPHIHQAWFDCLDGCTSWLGCPAVRCLPCCHCSLHCTVRFTVLHTAALPCTPLYYTPLRCIPPRHPGRHHEGHPGRQDAEHPAQPADARHLQDTPGPDRQGHQVGASFTTQHPCTHGLHWAC